MSKELEELAFLNGLRDDLKQFESKNIYRCPCCEKIQEWDDVNYNPEENTYTCPYCKESMCFNSKCQECGKDIAIDYETISVIAKEDAFCCKVCTATFLSNRHEECPLCSGNSPCADE